MYQAFKLLGYIDQQRLFSNEGIKALSLIKYCAVAIIGLLLGAILFIRFMVTGDDDPAGPTMLGMITMLASLVIATTAAVLQKLLTSAINLKSENDLIV